MHNESRAIRYSEQYNSNIHHDHDASHGHDEPYKDTLDPDPDIDDLFLANDENPIWLQENVTLHSVGIDIGFSGTQVVFSKLKLQRNGAGLATRFVVIERTSLYQSDVSFTPFSPGMIIDAQKLGEIIDEAYNQAKISPDQVDTGIVILTGEALRRENAQTIAMVVSETAGDFVCATAGHHMEATLAAYGSGAVQVSQDTGRKILNIDIGGGTTKLSLIDAGKLISTAAFHVGGRLLATDEHRIVNRLEDSAIEFARKTGISLNLGDKITDADIHVLVNTMVDTVVAAVTKESTSPTIDIPYLTDPISNLTDIDGMIFSGGVSEYVYGSETRDFGDLGIHLGKAIKIKIEDGSIPYELIPATAKIRATALGASEFSVQLSGNTCYIADAEKLLPRRNLQVIKPAFTLDHQIDIEGVAESIRTKIEAFANPDLTNEIVLAMNWSGELSYDRLHSLAKAIVKGLEERTRAGKSIILAFDADLAKALGSMLRDEFDLGVNILVVDGLNLLDFDYIDLGHPLQPSLAVPVTIKSLVF